MLIDDSIVRGTTSLKLVRAVRAAGAAEVGLADITQLVAENALRLLEVFTGLDEIGALVGEVDGADEVHDLGVFGERGDGGGAVVGAVEGADGDRGLAVFASGGGVPADAGDPRVVVEGAQVEPHPSAVIKRGDGNGE